MEDSDIARDVALVSRRDRGLVGESRPWWAGARCRRGVQWNDRATSPLLRSDFAQSTAGRTPNGDLTDKFRPQRRKSRPPREQLAAEMAIPAREGRSHGSRVINE